MLTDYVSINDIKLNLESSERDEAFAELTELLVAKCPSLNRVEYMKALTEREGKMSTAVFPGIAVPHAVCESAKETSIVIGISKSGIEFEATDASQKDNPVVNVIFQAAFERENTGSHLNVLRDILYIVSKPEFSEGILKANSSQEVYELIQELEY